MLGRLKPRRLILVLPIGAILLLLPTGAQTPSAPSPFNGPETLYYTAEWRLITAGTAKLSIKPDSNAGRDGWEAQLHLESAGLVSKLYKIDDDYTSTYDPPFCITSELMIANEGHRRRETKVTYAHDKADYVERDLIKNVVTTTKVSDVPHCVHDVLGALAQLRTMRVEVGKSVELPISTGKKTAQIRIEAQEREDVKLKAKVYKTVRYEAFVFNNILYNRKARLLIWMTDDAQHLPVQLQVRMSFPVGTITLSLDKVEK